MNVWGNYLSPELVQDLYWRCDRYVGSVRGWPDFQAGIQGGVTVSININASKTLKYKSIGLAHDKAMYNTFNDPGM